VWQELRNELHSKGLEIVTVGIDTAGAEACRPFIEAANPEHPSLVDVGHIVAERFGVINIPNGLWIDENGIIVRPAEPAFPGRPTPRAAGDMGEIPDRMLAIFGEAMKIEAEPDAYAAAIRDWADKGAASKHVLPPDEVVARSGARGTDESEAAAHFALAQHLWRAGNHRRAETHFRAAHRLHPTNFSYKRQAWSLATPDMGPFERYWQGPIPGREHEWPYESDWLTEVKSMGAANYYPKVSL
jgi:hypothetical protein